MNKISQRIAISAALMMFLTGCSQQQIAGDSSQVSPDQVSKNCPSCNAPVVKPVDEPPVVAAVKPAPKPTVRKVYQKRRHVPTVPSKKQASSQMVSRIQQALSAKGYNVGNVDGVMGTKTISALSAFQRANRLPTGDLNLATMRALGLMR